MGQDLPLPSPFSGSDSIFVDRLKRLYAEGKLVCTGKCAKLACSARFQRFVDKLHKKRWNVYSKKPFGGIEGVHSYLAKYTHRIAISNRRLISFDDNAVTFYTRNRKTVSLTPLGFSARFISHVLPQNFIRIRHFGLYAPGNVKTRLQQAKAALQTNLVAPAMSASQNLNHKTDPLDEPDYITRYRIATGVDLSRCLRCGAIMIAYMLASELPESRIRTSRAPPEPA